jgi:hypothetical protein
MQTTQPLKFVRKPANLDYVRAEEGDSRPALVMETRQVTAAEYDAVGRNLFASRAWLAGKGGMEGGAARCVALEAPERATMYINPEGSDYARYVALAA